ncbi:DUF2797 domain-containing protein [Streptomyces cuspidosporus]|uniref:DUF2797 domain-containing protein n=1 Tax=Streptomyces cuspidosporus TaxID=66882 RepID=A0ABN3GD58_9ACTN
MTRWRCAGLRWDRSGPALAWHHPVHGDRVSPLPPGHPLAFTVVSDADAAAGPRTAAVPATASRGRRGEREAAATGRGCVGVRRGARHTPCPAGAEVPVSAVSARCPDCARLDRSYSVAADTRTDDPRPYDVYLAWFGPELIKVGITAAERGGARLLEQAALSYTLLGRGPLMAARRAEAVLGAALGVPDRFPYAAKRAAREAPPPQRERAAQLAAVHARAAALGGLPESLTLRPCTPVHHDAVFHLDRLRPAHGVIRLGPGRTVAGRVEAAAGPDVYLTDSAGRTLLLDTRHLAGWPLAAAPADAATTAEVAAPAREAVEPQTLFGSSAIPAPTDA